MQNKFLYFLFLFLLLAPDAFGLDKATPNKQPPEIYIDKGACPFECCTYQEWTAETDIIIYDLPNSSKEIGKVKKGEKVTGLTGQVEMHPFKVTVIKDHTDETKNKFKKGEIFYLLTSIGEGFFKAWIQGEIKEIEGWGIAGMPGLISVDQDNPWAKIEGEYKYVWWKKIKTMSGVVGWTTQDEFSNVDACG